MPTASERARQEATRWLDLSRHWGPGAAADVWAVRPPTEKDVVVFFDPHQDLARRVRDWDHSLEGDDLASLATLAAGLAKIEADAWQSDSGDVAMRAYEARRLLFSDRILHWAVPWLDRVGWWFPRHRETASADRDFLLELGDEMRPAPALAGHEGLTLPGQDGYGPTQPPTETGSWVSSLWSGDLLDVTLVEVPADTKGAFEAPSLAEVFDLAARRWRDMASEHPGSAQLWIDLGERASRTARLLEE